MIQDKLQQLKKIMGTGKSFATIVFYSEEPRHAELSIESMLKVMRRVGVGLDAEVVPLEINSGGIIPTAFDRVLSQRLGEMAFNRLLKKMQTSNHAFETVGIRKKGVFSTPYHETDAMGMTGCACPSDFENEIQHCFVRVSLINGSCVGLGGNVKWLDTSKTNAWKGLWICRKCGCSRDIAFDPQKLLCVRCEEADCFNFGYIRNSRKF